MGVFIAQESSASNNVYLGLENALKKLAAKDQIAMIETSIHWIPDAYWLRHHQHAIGVLAGTILAIKQIPYIVSIVIGRTRPNRTSWAIWTTLGALALAAYIQTGETDDLWIPIALVVTTLTVTLLAIRYGSVGDGRLDRRVLIFAGAAMMVWFISGSAALGLAMILIADMVGTLPTLRQSYLQPDSEYLPAWWASLLGYTINLFAVEHWSVFHASYPVYLVLWSLCIIAAILIGRRRQRKLNVADQP
ncbi:MAG TPA: hypothetical protein VJ984_02740 [Xanthomonadales bacterium]|nr:hypothetical protein [Xanthomonadales bacterium]